VNLDFVGEWHAAKPQVFNTGYNVDLPGRRRPSPRRFKRPWRVTVKAATRGKFRTHAEAIAYADNLARKGKK
jgi:hypothetical protein